jgi:hypothetical protein
MRIKIMWGGWAESVVWFVCTVSIVAQLDPTNCPGDLGSRNTSAFRWGLERKRKELMDSRLDTVEDPFEDTLKVSFQWQHMTTYDNHVDNIWQPYWQTCWQPCWQPCWLPCQWKQEEAAEEPKAERPSGMCFCRLCTYCMTLIDIDWHCMTSYDCVLCYAVLCCAMLCYAVLCCAMLCFYALFCAQEPIQADRPMCCRGPSRASRGRGGVNLHVY